MENEGINSDFSPYVNVGDKMDWKQVIQRSLEKAHNCSDRFWRREFIRQASTIIANNYPGLDARTDIVKYMKELKTEIDKKHDKWLDENWHLSRAKKDIKKQQFTDQYFDELLKFLTNYASTKRMMLFGSPQSKGLSYDDL